MRRFLVTGAMLLALLPAARAQWPWSALNFLTADGAIDTALVPECSGLVQSLRYTGVFWALSDSGNAPAIAAIQADGKPARGWGSPVRVEGVRNYDWEDLALDEKGNLIIADVGNNSGRRKQLMLHFVREPKPGATTARPFRTLRVHYEDQEETSADFDCEAVFSAGGRIYLLTKRRSDSFTRLYRLEGESTTRSNPLRFIDTFDIGGMATAADTSPDGRRVAVLTYTRLWVFDHDRKTGSIFRGTIRSAPIFAWQAEAVAFDGNDSVVVGNESGQLYRVPLAGLKVVRP